MLETISSERHLALLRLRGFLPSLFYALVEATYNRRIYGEEQT